MSARVDVESGSAKQLEHRLVTIGDGKQRDAGEWMVRAPRNLFTTNGILQWALPSLSYHRFRSRARSSGARFHGYNTTVTISKTTAGALVEIWGVNDAALRRLRMENWTTINTATTASS
ncbi:hypothetical protein D9619_011021 [Psilocybe cf. subviscida]|uniref:Uncharacterized protein n=1 Tax=Psilocybe cf. subviscida TaxID=2480587 RepID=A0A8H5B900_9AGAR|nr:hypothetical protein D9619_011021 [Psilocybe cf. subviscida]